MFNMKRILWICLVFGVLILLKLLLSDFGLLPKSGTTYSRPVMYAGLVLLLLSTGINLFRR